MRVAVVGAGIVGATTAYELAADGHEVVVFDRRGSVAAEASFGHPGLLAPPGVLPWSAPGAPALLLKRWLARRDAVTFGGMPGTALAGWLWRAWRSGKPDPSQRVALQRLERDSRERVHALAARLHIEYEDAPGVLVLLRGDKEVAAARRDLRQLADLGVPFKLVDAARCRQIEPGLNAEIALQAGIHLPQHGAGNSRQFAHGLRAQAQARGAEFRFHHDVRSIVPGKTLELRFVSRDEDGVSVFVPAMSAMPKAVEGSERFDAVVVCSAMGAVPLLAKLGTRLPLRAVWGHAVSAPLRRNVPHEFGPRAALIDLRHGITIARTGQRVRAAGGAELMGRQSKLSKPALERLYRALHEWFPGTLQMQQAQPWKGAQAWLPDGMPWIGPTAHPGVWLNVGHGAAGWSLACGSARLLADRLAGRPGAPELAALHRS